MGALQAMSNRGKIALAASVLAIVVVARNAGNRLGGAPRGSGIDRNGHLSRSRVRANIALVVCMAVTLAS